MAQIMRLNQEYHEKCSLREQEVRRRTFWACILVDRSLAFLLSKPRAIDMASVAIGVPDGDSALAHDEPSRGVTLDDLMISHWRVSDLGLAPYFLKTVIIWSDLASFNVRRVRLKDKLPPDNPQSAFFGYALTLKTWFDNLNTSLGWNSQNYKRQCWLGQGEAFVTMHLLTHSAFCVAHQCYLPQLDGFTAISQSVDAAGWPYASSNEELTRTCISHALFAGEILKCVIEHSSSRKEANSTLQRTWVACSVLSISNTLLWLQYSQGALAVGDAPAQARTAFENIRELISTWAAEWKAARRWLSALDALESLYKAAYLGEMNEAMLGVEIVESSEEEGFRPRPGMGQRSHIDAPNLQASLQLAACDFTAESRNVHTIWLQLTGGWPMNLELDDPWKG